MWFVSVPWSHANHEYHITINVVFWFMSIYSLRPALPVFSRPSTLHTIHFWTDSPFLVCSNMFNRMFNLFNFHFIYCSSIMSRSESAPLLLALLLHLFPLLPGQHRLCTAYLWHGGDQFRMLQVTRTQSQNTVIRTIPCYPQWFCFAFRFDNVVLLVSLTVSF